MTDVAVLRIVVLGLRGIPEVQGGVERHCQNLYPHLVRMDHQVTLLARSPYVPAKEYSCDGIRVVPLWSPKLKSLETILHTFLGILWIALHRNEFDLIHIHAIGPAIMTPLACLTGLKVVVTNHGPDYDRQKWGGFAKWILRTGEAMGARFAHQMIAVSQTIRELVRTKHCVDAVYIPNGVVLPEKIDPGAVLKQFGLEAGRYVIAVGRLVPEKGFHDLISAYAELAPDWKLVLVGDADHEDTYSQGLKSQAGAVSGVVMTGFQKGNALGELYSNAGLFVLPSYHEGLPIVGLEAMSYELPMILSDIPANREIAEPHELFAVGKVEKLAEKLRFFFENPVHFVSTELHGKKRDRLTHEFDWQCIAEQTCAVYQMPRKQ